MKNKKLQGLLIKFAMPVIIIAAGILIASYLLNTKPKSKRKPLSKRAKLVETISIQPKNTMVKISGMGSVIPARQIELKPQVAGKIIEISPELIPGGILSKNQTLMKIEPDDYELTVKQRQSDVAKARSSLEIEYGNQAVAKQEYSLLGDAITENEKKLVLRRPQLISAQSNLKTAQAKLDQAKLDLKRTVITAPFNAVINQKYIDLGQMASQSTTVVKLTGTNEYWVEASVPVDKLKWIEIPDDNSGTGSEVKLYNPTAWGRNVCRTATVIRLLPDLETSGRMAKLIISVKNPMRINNPESGNDLLLLGSYVRVEITGRTIKSAYAIDRSLLRNRDNVWLLSKDNTLKIKPVKILYRGNESVITDSIDVTDKIITTDLSAPVEGMNLTTLPERNPQLSEKGQKSEPDKK